MRRLIVGSLVVALLSGCASVKGDSSRFGGSLRGEPKPARVYTPSACVDSLYLALKSRPLDSLSEREYEYFQRKDQECSEFARTEAQLAPEREKVDAANRFVSAYIGLAIVGTLITAAIVSGYDY